MSWNVHLQNIKMRVAFSLLGYLLRANIHHHDITNNVLNMLLLLSFLSQKAGSDHLLSISVLMALFRTFAAELCGAVVNFVTLQRKKFHKLHKSLSNILQGRDMMSIYGAFKTISSETAPCNQI